VSKNQSMETGTSQVSPEECILSNFTASLV